MGAADPHPPQTGTPAVSEAIAGTHPAVARLLALWPWASAVFSGVLLSLCFAPRNWGGLCWLALTPLLAALWFGAQASPLRRFLLGYTTGITFFTLTFSWLSALGELYGDPMLRGIPLLLALYMGLYPAVWAWIVGILCDGRRDSFLHSGTNLATGLAGAAVWVVLEWIRGWLFSGFGWNGLGVALHRDLAMIQICELTGVLGLSFLVAFANLMAVIIVRRLSAELGASFLKRVRWEFSLSMALIAGVFAFGAQRLLTPPPSDATSVRISAIQPNIPQREKFSPEMEDKVLAAIGRIHRLSVATRPDLILWPEAATPRGIYADETNYRFVLNLLADNDAPLLLGTEEIDTQEHKAFNTATLLTDKGQTAQGYRKMHLVPFGEYLPLRHSLPLMQMVAGELVPGDFTPGTEPALFNLERPALQFSALVCFEDTLGDLTRQFVLRGSQLLVNLTNDGWFLHTPAAEQHLANAVFRAVENRRPLVRCANTGVTCAISPLGRVDRWVDPFAEGFATREVSVPTDGPLTLYTRAGDWLVWVCASASLLAIALRKIRH